MVENKTNYLVFILRSTTLKKTTIMTSVISSQRGGKTQGVQKVFYITLLMMHNDAKHDSVHRFFHKMSYIAMFPECITIHTQKYMIKQIR